ncbi:MAG: glycosyltransferase [Lachnospiraceae bacterium]|nr:glycosyltransferase [Lachnospiraceae bacterium]
MVSVSVIIPSYNREKTIERSIRSVLDQTYADLEVIVVDDGSKDHTRKVVEAIKDDRVHYVYQSNQGACAARNHGIGEAKGEYIAFQDSDDVWRPEKLEKQLELMRRTSSDICLGKVQRHDQPEGFPEVFPEHIDSDGKIGYYELIKTPQVSTQTIVAKREVFEQVKFNPDMPALQDYEWSLRAGERFGCCILGKAPCVDQYLQSDSITYNEKKIYQAYRNLARDFEPIWMENRDGMGLEFYYACQYWGGQKTGQTTKTRRERYLRCQRIRKIS